MTTAIGSKVSIAAVVVTHNRLALLQGCLAAMRGQTRKLDEIIVVNNASTDGTTEWLAQQSDVTTVNQGNLGSGGGQYTGIKTAYEHDHTWIWCLDDDCWPAVNALEKLCDVFAKMPEGRVFNSLVLDKDDNKKIAFGYWLGRNVKDGTVGARYELVETLLADTADNVLDGQPQFFNCSLLHRDVVAKIGFPLARLFIRGDEEEYLLRVQMQGFRTYTVTDSIAFHPNFDIRWVSLLGKNILYESMDSWKRYYNARNAIFIERTYGSPHFSRLMPVKRMIRGILLELVGSRKSTFQKIKSCLAVVRGVKDGLRLQV